jgi:hypothetical protein
MKIKQEVSNIGEKEKCPFHCKDCGKQCMKDEGHQDRHQCYSGHTWVVFEE